MDKKLLLNKKVLEIIAIVLTIVIIAVMIYDIYYSPPDFSISINSMQGITEQNGVISTAITVKSEHGYKEPIILKGSKQHSGIKITFSISEAEPTYTSNMMIAVGSDVSIGSYEIIIRGEGGDGKEHSVKYTLIVLPSTPMHPPVIKITSPTEEDRVPVSIIINGIISGDLPQGQFIWVVINPHPNLGIWRPQVGRIEPSKGQWNIQAQLGGEKEDMGKKFDIAVILVDEKDNQYYWDYLMEKKTDKSYPEIPFPPSGKIMDRITVVRI